MVDRQWVEQQILEFGYTEIRRLLEAHGLGARPVPGPPRPLSSAAAKQELRGLELYDSSLAQAPVPLTKDYIEKMLFNIPRWPLNSSRENVIAGRDPMPFD